MTAREAQTESGKESAAGESRSWSQWECRQRALAHDSACTAGRREDLLTSSPHIALLLLFAVAKNQAFGHQSCGERLNSHLPGLPYFSSPDPVIVLIGPFN